MSVRVIYSTEASLQKNGNKPGTQSEGDFPSPDEAKAAAFPEGHTFAVIPIENGRYVYSARFGWEFHEGNG